MVDISTLAPGMRVKIVDEWGLRCQQNRDGEMDRYLGAIVTVAEIHDGYIFIEEDVLENDGGPWYWNAYCLDRVVDEIDTEIEAADDDELSSFLFNRANLSDGGMV